MSLINDALRRANTDKSRGPQPPAPVPPMQPVDPSPSSAPILSWAVLILGVGVLAIAAAVWFRPRSSPQTARNEAIPSTIPARSATPIAPATESEPAAQVTSEPLVTKSEPQTIAAAPAISLQSEPINAIPPAIQPAPTPAIPAQLAQPEPAATPEVREPAETRSPESKVAAAALPATTETKAISPEPRQSQPPRLQAIYYRLRKPTVVINGKTIGPGQSVDGIKVVSIQRTSVEVVQDGRYRTLTLQD
jgi:hypothetical protein